MDAEEWNAKRQERLAAWAADFDADSVVQAIRSMDQMLAELADDLATGDLWYRNRASRNMRRFLREALDGLTVDEMYNTLLMVRRGQERALRHFRRRDSAQQNAAKTQQGKAAQG